MSRGELVRVERTLSSRAELADVVGRLRQAFPRAPRWFEGPQRQWALVYIDAVTEGAGGRERHALVVTGRSEVALRDVVGEWRRIEEEGLRGLWAEAGVRGDDRP